MSAGKIMRQLREVADDLGVKIERIEHGNHVKFYVASPDGRRRDILTASITAPVDRVVFHFTKKCREFLKGVTHVR